MIRQFDEKQEELDLRSEAYLEECYIDPNETIDHPPVAISYGEHSYTTKDKEVTYPTPIGTYGNFSFIAAPPKHKKTFLVSLLSAAYLGGDSKRFTGKIKGHRDGKRILHFDTEQGKFHAQRVFKRALDMSGVSNECYRTYGLRARSYKERINIIDFAIRTIDNVGVVIIDGIADLVSDVNDIDEANEIVQKLMSWTEVYNIHIITVIHTNWGSTKPTGHLGSALQKKCETEIHLEKSEFDSSIIDVKCKSSRGRSFDSFSFFVNKAQLPEISNQDIDVLDLIGGNKNKHTNNPYPTPIGQGHSYRQNISA
jgi:hypothetical protein